MSTPINLLIIGCVCCGAAMTVRQADRARTAETVGGRICGDIAQARDMARRLRRSASNWLLITLAEACVAATVLERLQ